MINRALVVVGFVTLLAVAGHAAPQSARYPAHWWTPVPAEGAPAWEILPQAAKPGEVILSKRNELGLLSTGDLILKPDHIQEPNAPAAWRYYEILTLIRTELQRR